MNVFGLQKLSLLDFPGKMSCIVFTGGCNLRCPFCHNASLVTGLDEVEPVDEQEVFDLLKKRKGILEGVCITGGEPLIQPDLELFIIRVRELGYPVKLDTNGCFPGKLKSLVKKGLIDYVAMDIKNSPESYAKTVGIPGFDIEPVVASAAFLMENHIDYEFRTTVVKELHCESDFVSIAHWLKGAKRLYIQSFKDSGDIIGSGLSACSTEELERFKTVLLGSIGQVEVRGV